jgi:hypothetical protein
MRSVALSAWAQSRKSAVGAVIMRLAAVEFECAVGGVLRNIFLPLIICEVGSGGEEFMETCKPPFIIDLNNRRPRVWSESYL